MRPSQGKVVIIGAGPAGLFAADRLADQIGGANVTILESGRPMSERWCPETKVCACGRGCLVLEGEGGAGGFSDGKLPYSLTRGTQLEQIFSDKDEPKLWQVDDVVRELAGEGVWYDPVDVSDLPWNFTDEMQFGTYPLRHVGSDGVRRWSVGMTTRIQQKGVRIAYGVTVAKVDDDTEEPGVISTTGIAWDAERIIVASGIQGIPWSGRMLSQKGIPLGAGPAGIGLRVETPAEDMAPLFDRFYDWKIVYSPEDSPLVLRSFCCNQKGAIVNQWHRTMGVRGVNGHSSLDPNERTESSNFAVIAKIPTSYALDPQAYVKSVALGINSLSGGHTVCQWAEDFMDRPAPWTGRKVDAPWRTNAIMSRDGVDINRAMPDDLSFYFRVFIDLLFDAVPSLSVDRAIVYAPEVKYPARRVPIDFSSWQVQGHENLYVVGDASGYLDSFVAAAVSGLIAADHIASR